MVRLNDFSAHRQPEPQAHIARGKERRGGLFDSFGGETDAIVLDFDLQTSAPIRARFGVKPHTNFRIGGIGLERIEHHLG